MTDLSRILAACQFWPRSPSGVSCGIAAWTRNGGIVLRCAIAGSPLTVREVLVEAKRELENIWRHQP